MPTYKRKYRSGKTMWYYMFAMPGSTRQQRDRISESGFSTKREAEDAGTHRRIEEQQKRDLTKAGSSVTAPLPKTLSMLLEEFFRQHVDQKLAPKTIERYHEQAAYLHQDLLAMPIEEIRPLHLNREWVRLSKCGGHTQQG